MRVRVHSGGLIDWTDDPGQSSVTWPEVLGYLLYSAALVKALALSLANLVAPCGAAGAELSCSTSDADRYLKVRGRLWTWIAALVGQDLGGA